MNSLTDAEKRILNMSADLFNAIVALPVLHALDVAETVRDIHDIQNRIMARPVLRELGMPVAAPVVSPCNHTWYLEGRDDHHHKCSTCGAIE